MTTDWDTCTSNLTVEQKAFKLEESSQFKRKSNEGQGTSRFLVTMNYRTV